MDECAGERPPHDRRSARDRRRFVLRALEKPRTQAELRDALGLSNSGILHLLRHLQRDGLARPAEKIGCTRIWEGTQNKRSPGR
jgi:predicted ArsR family transcriptional regulator